MEYASRRKLQTIEPDASKIERTGQALGTVSVYKRGANAGTTFRGEKITSRLATRTAINRRVSNEELLKIEEWQLLGSKYSGIRPHESSHLSKEDTKP